MKCNPLLLLDWYKITHAEQYPKGLTKMVSYFTPRMSRVEEQSVILFGLQGFIKEYLIDGFNEYFFGRDKEEVLAEYARVVDNCMGKGTYDIQRIADLHDLGYLPLQIRALPEGTFVPMQVPCIEISNTHPNFVWLVNTIETTLSTTMWHTMVSANVGHMYRDIVEKWCDYTMECDLDPALAMGDFSMRGQESVESAIKSSAAFCLSFANTATVPVAMYLEKYYNCNLEQDFVIRGAISTEHSVMCSNYAIDGDEKTHIRRLLTKIYPHQSFSMVSDSYDYWNLITNILPQLKDEILRHDGRLAIRGDSGDPVEIIAGKKIEFFNCSFDKIKRKEHLWREGLICYSKTDGRCGIMRHGKLEDYTLTPEDKGTVWCLWEIFGGATNKYGFRVLDDHIRAIYGDSITPERAGAIYSRLADKGFTPQNVVLGAGSYSLQCRRENGETQPYTRDTFGIAVKATYAEDRDGKPIFIFKNPKTDTGKFKKSQKGCCRVYYDGMVLRYEDELTWDETQNDNALVTVFADGKMVVEQSLDEIRARVNVMYGGF